MNLNVDIITEQITVLSGTDNSTLSVQYWVEQLNFYKINTRNQMDIYNPRVKEGRQQISYLNRKLQKINNLLRQLENLS